MVGEIGVLGIWGLGDFRGSFRVRFLGRDGKVGSGDFVRGESRF